MMGEKWGDERLVLDNFKIVSLNDKDRVKGVSEISLFIPFIAKF
jgi:hypothetical protein